MVIIHFIIRKNHVWVKYQWIEVEIKDVCRYFWEWIGRNKNQGRWKVLWRLKVLYKREIILYGFLELELSNLKEGSDADHSDINDLFYHNYYDHHIYYDNHRLQKHLHDISITMQDELIF